MEYKQDRQTVLSWMAGNTVAANLLMAAILIGGLIYLSLITKEVFPKFDLDIVNIQISYPSASPEEVERGAVLAVEEEVRSIEGWRGSHQCPLRGEQVLRRNCSPGWMPIQFFRI